MHHDLRRIFDALNLVYFDGQLRDIKIGWKRARPLAPGAARTKWNYAHYYPDTRQISVHPVLCHAWVPQYFVSYIVFHECLHALYPYELIDGKPEWHTAAFNEAEKRYVHYERAQAWEKKHIDRLCRAKPGPTAPADTFDEDDEP